MSRAAANTPPRRRRRGPFSPLTRRILAINLIAPALMVAGMLYLDTYRRGLIDARFEALFVEGDLIAVALGETVVGDASGGDERIDLIAARQLLRRLIGPLDTRARLFASDGRLLVDSWRLDGAGGRVEAEPLAPPNGGRLGRAVETALDWLGALLSAREHLPPYVEREPQRAVDYGEATAALRGERARARRASGDANDGDVLSIAVPVQRFKRVQGALMLSATDADIEARVRAVRRAVLEIFAAALAVTVLLSVFLAGTIARPVRRLAEAADVVRQGKGSAAAIPDFSDRNDEIGDLSRALREMTDALNDRIGAIERFAADVAHEIKNPLSSLRSAVETVARVRDPEQQRNLLEIVQEDVQRLDRLISDISDASRLDAELARAEAESVDIGAMLAVLVDIHRATNAKPDVPEILLSAPPHGTLVTRGIEPRLVQVFENLIANARSFSPKGGVVRITARRIDGWIEITIEDQGPGVPAAKLEAIFERFYSERPAGEKFGTHSGLGLSISKQIVEAHGGTIAAENLGPDPDHAQGARFTIRLPG